MPKNKKPAGGRPAKNFDPSYAKKPAHRGQGGDRPGARKARWSNEDRAARSGQRDGGRPSGRGPVGSDRPARYDRDDWFRASTTAAPVGAASTVTTAPAGDGTTASAASTASVATARTAPAVTTASDPSAATTASAGTATAASAGSTATIAQAVSVGSTAATTGPAAASPTATTVGAERASTTVVPVASTTAATAASTVTSAVATPSGPTAGSSAAATTARPAPRASATTAGRIAPASTTGATVATAPVESAATTAMTAAPRASTATTAAPRAATVTTTAAPAASTPESAPGAKTATSSTARTAQQEERIDVVHERLEAQAVQAGDVAEVTFGSLGLGDNIVRALAAMGAASPFPIQASTAPSILEGRDVLARGRTGSGKTIAFGAPLVESILRAQKGTKRAYGRSPVALILAPTRELALQIDRTVQPIARAVGLFTTQIYGGVPQARQVGTLKKTIDIVIGTPGRIEDLQEQGKLDLSQVTTSVIDEADHMCELGFLEPVQRILRLTADGGQKLLFSEQYALSDTFSYVLLPRRRLAERPGAMKAEKWSSQSRAAPLGTGEPLGTRESSWRTSTRETRHSLRRKLTP